MKELPNKRKEALIKGSSWYYTGKPCVNGHVTKRLASNGYCYECSKCHASNWRVNNLEHLQEYERRVWQANKEKKREQFRDWTEKNRAKLTAKTGLRRALQDRATPAWVDKLALEKIYEDCRARTKATGVLYHVDHIVPLKNSLVCGLHVPRNLQLLTASENSRKRNRFNPELLEIT